MCLVMWGIYCFYGIWMDISCLNYIYMCNSSFAIPYIPKYFFTLLKQCFPTGKHRNPTGKQRNPVGKSGFRFLWFFWIFEFWNRKIRNFAGIRFSDTTGNGKFSGKPDLPSEIFFLALTTRPADCDATSWFRSVPVGVPRQLPSSLIPGRRRTRRRRRGSVISKIDQ